VNAALIAKVRSLAAADLYRMTGEKKWHDLFLTTFEIHHEEANWVYLQTKRERDSEKVELCRSELIRAADKILGEQQKVGFRWSRRGAGDEDWKWGLFSRPEGGDVLVRAWRLTGEPRFRRGMVLAAQMGLGANPNNVVYTSGLGRNPMRNVFYHDTLCQGIAFPAGLVAFGPVNPATSTTGMFSQIEAVAAFFVPAHAAWPQTEFCVDTGRVHVIDEHTPDATSGQATYLWGSLAFEHRLNNP
jgi:endoglucanase